MKYFPGVEIKINERGQIIIAAYTTKVHFHEVNMVTTAVKP